MKRSLVAPLSQVAYKIYSTPSSSITEKAAQFAGCVAHQASVSRLPAKRADAFGRLAAQNMLTLVQNSYRYSMMQAEKSAALQEAKSDQMRAQVPWLYTAASLQTQQAQLESIEVVRNRTMTDGLTLTDAETVYRSKSFQQTHVEIESSSSVYPKAFCVAFLAFEHAAKTNSQKEFEAVIQKALLDELAEPFSYTEFFLQILKSREMSTVMGIVLCLGLLMLALPSLGVAVLPEATHYAVGSGMTLLGGAYHIWRWFSAEPKIPEEDVEERLIPQTI